MSVPTERRCVGAVAIVVVTLVAAACGGGENAEQSRETQVDAIFSAIGPRDPGCSVAVRVGDDVVLTKGYGMANLASGTPITPATEFDIASVAKQFTAATVFLLAEEGIIDLQRDVHDYVPELPDYGAPVTVENLIHHTSGLPDYIRLMYEKGLQTDARTDDNDALTVLRGAGTLSFRPGASYDYGDTGYFLLSRVVLAATGRSLREVAAEKIFRPLDMTDTTFRDGTVDTPAGAALGYRRLGGDWVVDTSEWRQVGDGSLYTSPTDLMKWAANFWTREVGGDVLFAAMTTRGRLTSGRTIDYGGGIELEGGGDGLVIAHSGAWAGDRADIDVRPAQRLAAAVACDNSDNKTPDYADRVADVYAD